MRVTLAAIAVAIGAVFILGPGAQATHEPANKVSAAGAETEIVRNTPGANDVIVLSETVKTSKPTDLILGVTAECSITTDVTTVGSDDQKGRGDVKFYVRIDNSPYTTHVPVALEDTDKGRVTFCNRTYQRTTSLGSDDENDSIRTFMETRESSAFNWMALDVGSGVHKIEVIARLETEESERASAIAVVGNRTLIVEPVKSANDETVTALG